MHARLLATLRASAKLFADETTVPVLDPGRRPDLDPTYARPAQYLAGFTGILQVGGYDAYRELASGGAVELAFCWAHVRRNFYELQAGDLPAPIASEALACIAGRYAVEAEIRGKTAGQRRHGRQ